MMFSMNEKLRWRVFEYNECVELMNEKNEQKRVDEIYCRTNRIKKKLSKECKYLITNVNI